MRLIVATDNGREIASVESYETYDRDYEKGSEALLQKLLDIDNQITRAARILLRATEELGPLMLPEAVDLLLDQDESLRDSDQARNILNGVFLIDRETFKITERRRIEEELEASHDAECDEERAGSDGLLDWE